MELGNGWRQIGAELHGKVDSSAILGGIQPEDVIETPVECLAEQLRFFRPLIDVVMLAAIAGRIDIQNAEWRPR